MSKRLPSTVPQGREDKARMRKPAHRPSGKHTRKRQPILARVLIENSSIPSQIAMVRPSEMRKQQSTTHSRFSSEPPKPPSRSTSATSNQHLPLSPPPYYPSDPLPQQVAPNPNKSPRHQYSSNSLSKPRLESKQVPLSISATKNPATPASPDISATQITAQASQPDLRKPRNLRPNTLYSIDSVRTGSTKLGEIPMHKWAEPWDYDVAERANMEALAGGWPVISGKEMERPKKAGWKRWFGRKAEMT
jgi:hypothetical protein